MSWADTYDLNATAWQARADATGSPEAAAIAEIYRGLATRERQRDWHFTHYDLDTGAVTVGRCA